ncbi:MAG: hypothetical protein KDC54_16410 [Lewinella sp.]|nr:hypothetical protein [Lewinella sp.]
MKNRHPFFPLLLATLLLYSCQPASPTSSDDAETTPMDDPYQPRPYVELTHPE